MNVGVEGEFTGVGEMAVIERSGGVKVGRSVVTTESAAVQGDGVERKLE